jgi:hypothetical protein
MRRNWGCSGRTRCSPRFALVALAVVLGVAGVIAVPVALVAGLIAGVVIAAYLVTGDSVPCGALPADDPDRDRPARRLDLRGDLLDRRPYGPRHSPAHRGRCGGLSMVRSAARAAFPFVAGLFAVCAVIQVFLAGLGVFDDESAFVTHREFGYMISCCRSCWWCSRWSAACRGGTPASAPSLFVLFMLQSVFVQCATACRRWRLSTPSTGS